MTQNKSFSFTPLIISVCIHLAVILSIALLLYLLSFLHPISSTPNTPLQTKEERFRLSIKEQPNVKKESILNNHIQIPPKARPIPRGEQLNHVTPQPIQPAPIEIPLQPIPAEPKKAFERYVPKQVATIERQPKKEPGLYEILSRADTSASEKPSKSSTKVADTIQKLYGDKFNDLSEGEQKYILDNQEAMRRITQGVLDRYARSRIPDNIRTNDTNMIEFHLHPDGSISDIRFIKNSQLSILDDTTKEVIELSYAKYPRPDQKTLIRYRVWYNLTGY